MEGKTWRQRAKGGERETEIQSRGEGNRDKRERESVWGEVLISKGKIEREEKEKEKRQRERRQTYRDNRETQGQRQT